MRVGDKVKIRVLAEEWNAKVLEVEKYSNAYILRYEFVPSRKQAMCTVFPEIPMMPPLGFYTSELYELMGYLEWEGRLFPMPIRDPRKGAKTMLPAQDQRLVMRRRVDLINAYYRWWSQGDKYLHDIVPDSEWEYAQWRKLAQNSGEV